MKGLDLFTILGYIGVVLLFTIALLLEKASPIEIIHPPALIMAFGGAAIGVLIQFTAEDFKSAFGVIRKCFVYDKFDIEKMIADMARYAAVARKEGIMALEREAAIAEDPFLKRALQLAVDGTSPDVMEQMLMTELRTIEDRHKSGKAIYDTMATFCPAFGMLGTILALSLVLKSLDDPKMIGPKMATALLSTFYGVLGCYAIFTPVAKKLDKRHSEEALAKRVILRGIMSIQAGDGPRMVEAKLSVFLRQKKA